MAYKRRRSYRRKRPAFSKRQKEAIIRISQKPVETKCFNANWNWSALLLQAGYTPGNNSVAIRLPVYQTIPRSTNVSTTDEDGFVGNEIMLRGFRLELHAYFNVPSATPDAVWRVTVFSENSTVGGLPAGVASGDNIFDPDFDSIPTWARWNHQVAKIYMQRTWYQGQSNDGQSVVNKKLWWRSGRKLVSESEESGILNSYFGDAKNTNIYCMIEVLSPGQNDLAAAMTCRVNLSTYFKDA